MVQQILLKSPEHINYGMATQFEFDEKNGGGVTFFIMFGGGAGKARFNVATPTNATVTCTVYVLPGGVTPIETLYGDVPPKWVGF